MYFIENQVSGINPHDHLTYEESAEIIIKHVTLGLNWRKSINCHTKSRTSFPPTMAPEK